MCNVRREVTRAFVIRYSDEDVNVPPPAAQLETSISKAKAAIEEHWAAPSKMTSQSVSITNYMDADDGAWILLAALVTFSEILEGDEADWPG